MTEFLPLLAPRQLHLQSPLGVLHEQRETESNLRREIQILSPNHSRSIVAVLAASSDGVIHVTLLDVCFIIVVFYVQRTELALVEAHFLMAVLRRTFVVLVALIVDDQRRIIKQSCMIN